jgi:phosphoribosylcarboxyaminoimidazole (NCAIR) mutase
MALVGVVMGSKSDRATVKVVSADRTRDLIFEHDHDAVREKLERFRQDQTDAVLAGSDPRTP